MSDLPQDLFEAGKRYMDAVYQLGLRASFATFGQDRATDEYRLLIATDWADRFGSKRLYELLFTAYERAAVPKEIDPFMVEIFSLKTFFAVRAEDGIRSMQEGFGVGEIEFGNTKDGTFQKVVPQNMTRYVDVGDFVISEKWVLDVHWKPRKSVEESRLFKRFERQVMALAA